jgi:hypothetical protein
LLMAHVMLPICKGAMVNQPVTPVFGDWDFTLSLLGFNWKDRCRLVEIELLLELILISCFRSMYVSFLVCTMTRKSCTCR